MLREDTHVLSSHACIWGQQLVGCCLCNVLANLQYKSISNGFMLLFFLQKHQDITFCPPYTTIKELLPYTLLFKEGAAKITAMLCQGRQMCKTEFFLSYGEIGGACRLGKANRLNGIKPVWFVISPVSLETKVPTTEQARISELIPLICTQLQVFGAMPFESTRINFGGWVMEVKSNERAILKGTGVYIGRLLAKGKFWALHTSTMKPPGVKLADMEMNEELSKKKQTQIAKTQSENFKHKRDFQRVDTSTACNAQIEKARFCQNSTMLVLLL
jgi:hypothetical protein